MSNHPFYITDAATSRIAAEGELTYAEIVDRLLANSSQFRPDKMIRSEILRLQNLCDVKGDPDTLKSTAMQFVDLMSQGMGSPTTAVWITSDLDRLATKRVPHPFILELDNNWSKGADFDEVSRVCPVGAAKLFSTVERNEGGTFFKKDGRVSSYVTLSHYKTGGKTKLLLEVGGIQRNILDSQFPLRRELANYETNHLAGLIVIANNLLKTIKRAILTGIVSQTQKIKEDPHAWLLLCVAADAWYGKGRNWKKMIATPATKDKWQLKKTFGTTKQMTEWFLNNFTKSHHPGLAAVVKEAF